MKAQNMTWKEINEALPGKALDDIKNKYRALYLDAPANVKPKEAEAKKEETKKTENTKEDKKEENKGEAKGDEAKAAEEKKQGSKDNKKSGEGKQGKKGQKGQKGQRGKQTAEEAEVEEAQPEGKMGILKAKARAEGVGQGGELESIHGHPVIFVDDYEELEYEEVSLRAMRSFVGLRLMFAIASVPLCPQYAPRRAKVDHGRLKVFRQVWKKDRSSEAEGETGGYFVESRP